MVQVYISHSGRDAEQAEHLFAWLDAHGFAPALPGRAVLADGTTGFDTERAPGPGLNRADVVLVILSANWLACRSCFAEFVQARARGKRIIPLIAAPRGSITSSAENGYLDLTRDRDGARARLAAELAASAPDAKGKNNKGVALIETSLRDHDAAAARRQRLRRRIRIGSIAAAAVLAAIVAVGAWQMRDARLAGRSAEAGLREAQITQSRLIGMVSGQLAERGDAVTAQLLALEGLPDRTSRPRNERPYLADAEVALYGSFHRPMREIGILGEHDDIVADAAFDDAGKRIATASYDGTARIWDAATLSVLHVLQPADPGGERASSDAADRTVRSVRFSHDGSRVVTASWDGAARIWDATSGALLATLRDGNDRLDGAIFSADDQLVLVRRGNAIVVWDAKTARHAEAFGAERLGGQAVRAISPNARFVVTTPEGEAGFGVWDMVTGARLTDRKGDVSFASGYRLAFSPDSRRLAIAAGETVRIWELVAGNLRRLHEESDIGDGALSFSADGRRLLIRSSVALHVIDVDTRQSLPEPSIDHRHVIMDAVFSPDGGLVLTASADKTARLWDGETGQPVLTLAGHLSRVYRANFSPDGRRVVTASEDGTARVWDIGAAGVVVLSGHDDEVLKAQFLSKREAITFARDGARVWSTETGRESRSVAVPDNIRPLSLSQDGRFLLFDAGDNVAQIFDLERQERSKRFENARVAAMSADGARAATSSFDGAIRLWEARTDATRELSGHRDEVEDLAFSPDGTLLASGSADGTARLWDTRSGTLIATLGGHTKDVTHVVFSRDGQRLASISEDRSARIWDVATRKPIAVLTAPEGEESFSDLRFSDDAATIVTVGNGSATVFDVKSGRPIRTLHGLGGDSSMADFSAVAFAPRANRFVTASWNDTARLWDAATGEQLAVLSGHVRDVTAVEFNPDGTQVLTASRDATARLWRLFASTQGLLEAVKSAVPRCLTLRQRVEFGLRLEPPRWCFTGAGREQEPDPAKWRGKWPFDSTSWQDWLKAKDRGDNPALNLPERRYASE